VLISIEIKRKHNQNVNVSLLIKRWMYPDWIHVW